MSRPFAVSDRDDETQLSIPTVVVSVQISAPVDGQVTLNSTTSVQEPDVGEFVICSIGIPQAIITTDSDYHQTSRSPGGIGDEFVMSGTRTSDIAAGEGVTYALVCSHSQGSDGGDSAGLSDTVLTAVFTPAP
jgi:hypothetical protein